MVTIPLEGAPQVRVIAWSHEDEVRMLQWLGGSRSARAAISEALDRLGEREAA